ncbi:MAG: hypothetical protein ACKOEO_16660, partial [Planctomycetaceae bacterium]
MSASQSPPAPASANIPQPSPEQLAALALSLAPGLGPRLLSQLLAQFGDCHTILRQSASSLRTVSGIGPQIASAIASPTLPQQATQLW